MTVRREDGHRRDDRRRRRSSPASRSRRARSVRHAGRARGRPQLRALALWPALETEPLGDWTAALRPPHGGARRRANSVLAMASPAAGAPTRSSGCVAHYAALGRRPIAASLPDSAEDELFRAHGWVPGDGDGPTRCSRSPASPPLRRDARRPAGVRRPSWTGSGDHVRATDRRRPAPRPGVAAYADDWVRAARHRGRPRRTAAGASALAVIAALLDWGAERGADDGVPPGRRPTTPGASRSTSGIGFVTHHAYRYLAADRRRQPAGREPTRRPRLGDVPRGVTHPQPEPGCSSGDRASGVPTRGRTSASGEPPAKVWWHRDLAPAHTSRASSHLEVSTMTTSTARPPTALPPTCPRPSRARPSGCRAGCTGAASWPRVTFLVAARPHRPGPGGAARGHADVPPEETTVEVVGTATANAQAPGGVEVTDADGPRR